MTINNGAISGLTSPAPLAERLRVAHFNRYQDILRGNTRDSSAGNVLASMLLGNRRLLSDKQIELYRNSGTYHLFAVSGLHTGCMAVFIAGTLRLLRIPDRWALPLVLAAVWYYVWLTGNSPSSVRSAIMISCLMAGRLLWRQSQPFPALVASAWIVLLIQPDQLFSLGFQLSYAVVASIILIGLPLSAFASQILSRHIQAGVPSHVRNRLLARISQSIMGVTCISLSAGCISMPLILQHFNLFTPCGVLIGIVLNPLASATIMTGCLTMLLTPMVPALASLVAMAAWPLIRVMEWLLVAATSVPGAYSTRVWIHPQMGAIVVILAIAIAWGLQYLRQQRMHGSPMTCLIPILFVAAALGFGSVDA